MDSNNIIAIVVYLFTFWLMYYIFETVRHDKISAMFHGSPWYPGKYAIRLIIRLFKGREDNDL